MSGAIAGLAGTFRGVTQTARAIGNLAADFGFGGASGNYGVVPPGLGAWAQGLQPASWRGRSFAVRVSGLHRGRRVAVHEYPYRDKVWVEDLGLGTRTVSFSGFLVGDNVYAERQAMIAEVEKPGPGTLVHPSLGSIQAVCVEFSCGEESRRGRVVELEFSFIQTGLSTAAFPAISAALQAFAPSTGSFASDFGSAVSTVQGGISTIGSFVGYAQHVVGDASLVARAVTGLVGNFGRYSERPTLEPAIGQLDGRLRSRSGHRRALRRHRRRQRREQPRRVVLMSTQSDALAAAVQALTDAVAAAAQDPADQIRLLLDLAANGASPANNSTDEVAAAALCRRSALASAVVAASNYLPSSYQDALRMQARIVAAIDAEITIAGDGGNDATYAALRDMRANVIQTLTTLAAELPLLITVTRAASLPSLALAWQLYADATRSDDLIARADPPHPAWMPTSFEALAT